MLNNPLYPSIRLAPLTTNKKHKQTKNKAKKFELLIQLSKSSIPVFLTQKLLYFTNKINKKIIKKSLIFGFKFILRSSVNPRKKNSVQKVKYSYKTIFLKKNKYKQTKENERKMLTPPKRGIGDLWKAWGFSN